MPTPEQAKISRLETMVERLVKELQAGRTPPAKNQQEKMHNQLSNALPESLRPLNVGEYSNVIWSYFFPFGAADVEPQSAVDAMTTITQEAAFICTHMSKMVFVRTGAPGARVYTGLDALNQDIAIGGAVGLKFTLTDAQSGRSITNAPEALDLIGPAEYPRELPSPQFFLPNSTIVCRFQNDHATAVYRPYLVLIGARVRIDEAQKVFGTMLG